MQLNDMQLKNTSNVTLFKKIVENCRKELHSHNSANRQTHEQKGKPKDRQQTPNSWAQMI